MNTNSIPRSLLLPTESPLQKEQAIRDYEARRIDRIARLQARADKYGAKATGLTARAHQLASVIPFGQPILVGHYSEGRDRRYRDRIYRTFAQSHQAFQEAQTAQSQADAAADNTAIKSDDPAADDKLAEKLAALKAKHDLMRTTNRAWRSHLKGKSAALAALGFTGEKLVALEKVISERSNFNRQPHARFELTNLSATIRSTEKRLEKIKVTQATPDTTKTGNGITMEDRPAENRVRLRFPAKPDDSIRRELKRQGFRWTPSQGIYQAYRNSWSLHYANNRVMETGK